MDLGDPRDSALALPYAVSRAGLAALGQNLHTALAAQGVHVVSLPVADEPAAAAGAVLTAVRAVV